jgi:hypothetical protein
LNRFDPRKTEFGDDRLAKALGAKPRWKVPNDYASADGGVTLTASSRGVITY